MFTYDGNSINIDKAPRNCDIPIMGSEEIRLTDNDNTGYLKICNKSKSINSINILASTPKDKLIITFNLKTNSPEVCKTLDLYNFNYKINLTNIIPKKVKYNNLNSGYINFYYKKIDVNDIKNMLNDNFNYLEIKNSKLENIPSFYLSEDKNHELNLRCNFALVIYDSKIENLKSNKSSIYEIKITNTKLKYSIIFNNFTIKNFNNNEYKNQCNLHKICLERGQEKYNLQYSKTDKDIDISFIECNYAYFYINECTLYSLTFDTTNSEIYIRNYTGTHINFDQSNKYSSYGTNKMHIDMDNNVNINEIRVSTKDIFYFTFCSNKNIRKLNIDNVTSNHQEYYFISKIEVDVPEIKESFYISNNAINNIANIDIPSIKNFKLPSIKNKITYMTILILFWLCRFIGFRDTYPKTEGQREKYREMANAFLQKGDNKNGGIFKALQHKHNKNGIISSLYHFFSESGNNFYRPIIWIVIFNMVLIPLMLIIMNDKNIYDALKFSIINAFKPFFDINQFNSSYPVGWIFINIFQLISNISFVSIFIISLRWRFRRE